MHVLLCLSCMFCLRKHTGYEHRICQRWPPPEQECKLARCHTSSARRERRGVLRLNAQCIARKEKGSEEEGPHEWKNHAVVQGGQLHPPSARSPGASDGDRARWPWMRTTSGHATHCSRDLAKLHKQNPENRKKKTLPNRTRMARCTAPCVYSARCRL